MKTIARTSNEDLLREFASLERWAGDDFSVHPIEDRHRRRATKLEAEILRRMSANATDFHGRIEKQIAEFDRPGGGP